MIHWRSGCGIGSNKTSDPDEVTCENCKRTISYIYTVENPGVPFWQWMRERERRMRHYNQDMAQKRKRELG